MPGDGARPRLRAAALVLALACAVIVAVGAATLGNASPATAQTTDTTSAPSTTSTSSTPVTTTDTEPQQPLAGSDDDGLPWILILGGVAILVAIAIALAMVNARHRAAHHLVDDWRRHAAEETAEAGALSRLLSTGAALTGEVAQALVRSLRAFDALERTAPDETTEAAARRARSALLALGRAVEADHRARRGGASAPPDDLVQTTAAETDRALRGLFRWLTDAGGRR